MNDCTGSGQTPPTVDDPCALLPQLRAALYQLLSGQARAQVRNGDQWLTWHRSDVKTLQHEVRRLENICGYAANQGRAIRVGPYSPFTAPYPRNRRY
jgi:hypothetical protein